jgi:carbonic anhydrase
MPAQQSEKIRQLSVHPTRPVMTKKKSTPAKTPDVFETPPRKNVMLLSCMDQRLLDDIVRFMNELNLHNRYDQVIFAGAAMGAARLGTPLFEPDADKLPWKRVFFDHLITAIEGLDRPVSDIFLLEHADCGAYGKLHPVENIQKKYKACDHLDGWRPFHHAEATAFAQEVIAFCRTRTKKIDVWEKIQVWSLLMDLRGNVETLGCVSY